MPAAVEVKRLSPGNSAVSEYKYKEAGEKRIHYSWPDHLKHISIKFIEWWKGYEKKKYWSNTNKFKKNHYKQKKAYLKVGVPIQLVHLNSFVQLLQAACKMFQNNLYLIL